ncbi:MAG: alpha/beta hydrolase [Proteobacteria bacterium]|nr:alpha/beta hydrolase [Pseudomonadota bacterium]
MPKTRVNDIDMYYEVHGQGQPLVMIRGFGSNAGHWYAQIPALAPHFQVVIFDNRGIGRTDQPDSPYSISMMAEDTVGLMTALGLERVHVLGMSMGGMIAQRIAIDHPERVKGLVLVCTHCGGDQLVRASDEVLGIFSEYVMTGTPEAAARTPECLFAPDTVAKRPEIVRGYQAVSAEHPPSLQSMMNQFAAVQGHDTFHDLPRVQAPTLVLTGDLDVLIPPENSRILAERIPGARLRIIEGGAHQFTVEQADAFNQAVLDFLQALE